MTTMQIYRPHNLNVYVNFCIEPDVLFNILMFYILLNSLLILFGRHPPQIATDLEPGSLSVASIKGCRWSVQRGQPASYEPPSAAQGGKGLTQAGMRARLYGPFTGLYTAICGPLKVYVRLYTAL